MMGSRRSGRRKCRALNLGEHLRQHFPACGIEMALESGDGVSTPSESPLPPAILRSLGDRSYDKPLAGALSLFLKSLTEM